MTIRAELATILRTTEKNLDARIKGMRLGPVCGRCGGSGRYSFNQIDGDRCFGCRGAGHVLPREGVEFAATCERAEVVAKDGTLDAYTGRILARARCSNGTARVFAAWKKMDAMNGYGKNWRNLDALPNRDQVVSRNKIGVDLIDALNKMEKGENTDWVEYDRVLTSGLAALASATADLEAQQVAA